ncbi:fimbria/pilus outer membrane usher protein, partial [Variovorax sp. 2RAF20]
LMPGGSRSDLTVEVANAGGITERFTVPYSTVSDMLRSGSSEWLLTAGNVQLHDVDLHPAFVQGNGSHGINNYLTLYSGATLSQD